MATITVPGMFLTGNHAGRPGSGVGKGTLYSCTTHGLVYQTTDTGATWVTWATLGSTPSGSITASGYTQNTARLLGRTTASAGAVEEITVGSGLSMAGGTISATGSGTPAFVGARVYNSGNLSINDSTATALTFNTERYDTTTFHDTGSNTSRLTVGTTGYYRIGGTIEWAANATGYRQMGIRLGGTTYLAFQVLQNVGASQETRMAITTDYALSSTNYVELIVAQNSGGALNVNAGGNYSPEFYIQFLGA